MLEPRVRTSCGELVGDAADGVAAFKGIPFAAPPTGTRRWRPPEPPEPWRGTRAATTFGNSAMQGSLGPMGDLIGVAARPISEDCLYLNVWTPGNDDRARPVLVWIHGGGNVVGSGSQPRVNGETLARRGNVVVVTINYRLGAFGFLHAPELGASGNEALLDQVAALRWVRAEIGAFGGDPRRVTVFGQSAGGFDIAELMAMPAAEGCFDAAIPMSGSLSPHVTKEQATAATARYAEKFGGIEKLRLTSAHDVLAFQTELTRGQLGGAVRFGPVQDGVVIREDASGPLGRGDHTRGMPLLIGHAAQEYGLWTGTDPSMETLDDAGLLKLASRVFHARAADAVDVYRSARGRRGESIRPVAIWTAMMTDSMFRVPAIRTAELHVSHTPNTWVYRFDYASPAYGGKLGACHSLDIPFVWGTLGAENMARFCGEGRAVEALSETMMQTYLAFAKTHDPANPALPLWPRYTTERRATMRFGETCSVVNAPADDERAFWASIS